jgi:acetoin utilization protein AcuB
MNLIIKDYMTPTPHSIEPGQSLDEAKRRMIRLGCEHLPVLSGRQIVGVISDRDILFVRSLQNEDARESIQEANKVGDVMITEVFTMDETCTVVEVASAMLEKNIGSMLLTRSGELTGIFTATDLIKVLLEISGDKIKAAA